MIESSNIIAVIIAILDLVAIISVLGGMSSPGRKALRVIIILVLPVLGLILYYLLGRSPVDA